ncbi:hypothetical protein BSLG_004380 [Batrachochytrium salamandrivorans]|nr:hypothetical protein BSLG_004380 [Batrachochytrium salamandrivorans]
MQAFITTTAVIALFQMTEAAVPTISNYPAPMAVPPPNQVWSNRFLNHPQSHIPSIPVNTAPSTNSNFNGDVTHCINGNDWGHIFVIGSRVLDGYEFLQKAVAAGHDIGTHTWSHPYLTMLTNEQIVAEFMWTVTVIKDAVGIVPKYYRPPYGDIDDRVRAIASTMGLTAVGWSFAPGDTAGMTNVSSIMAVRANGTRDGVISLEHDFAYPYAIQAPGSLAAVLKAGWNVKPLSQCIQNNALYDDWLVMGQGISTSRTVTTGSGTSNTTSFPSTAGPGNINTAGAHSDTKSASMRSAQSGTVFLLACVFTVSLVFTVLL